MNNWHAAVTVCCEGVLTALRRLSGMGGVIWIDPYPSSGWCDILSVRKAEPTTGEIARMAEYRSQHYVPRAYLNAFVDETTPPGRDLWVYERGKEAYSSPPRKVAVSEYYYSFEGESGDKDHEIEKLLGRVEARAIPLLRDLAQGRDPSALKGEEREWVATFLGFMAVRIPGFRKSVEGSMSQVMKNVGVMAASHPKYFERTLKEAMQAAGKDLKQDPEEVRQFMLGGEYEVKMSPELSLLMLIPMAPAIAEYALNFEWRVLESAGDRFITSDRPLILVTTVPGLGPFGSSAGWLTPYMEATFPLSPTACLVVSLHHPSGRERVGAAQVAEINLRTSAYADAAIFASRRFDPVALAPPANWKWWRPVTAAVREDWLAAMEGPPKQP